MKRTKRIWALMLALLATLCLLPGAAMAEGEYCYWHKDSEKCRAITPIISGVYIEVSI